MKRIAPRIALVGGSMALMVGGLIALGSPAAEESPPAAATEPELTSYLAFEYVSEGVSRVAFYEDVPVLDPPEAADRSSWGDPTASVPLELNQKCDVTNLGADPIPAAPAPFPAPADVDKVGELLAISIEEAGQPVGSVQLIGSGLGSSGKGKCSRSGGRILEDQLMILSVGNWLEAQNYAFKNANLNLEAKFGAELDYEFVGGGSDTGVLLDNSGDNGPDSGDGDNNFKPLPEDLAYTLKIGPTGSTGEISLESGGDGPLPGTYFELIKAIGCDAGLTEINPETEETVDEVTFIRKANKNGVPCAPINVEITFSEDGDIVTIVPDTNLGSDGVDAVRAEVTVTWSVDRFKIVGEVPVAKTQVELDEDLARQIEYPNPLYVEGGTEPEWLDAVDVAYCAGNDASGNPIHPVAVDELGAEVIVEGEPLLQSWCMLDDGRTTSADGETITQVIRLDINGDPRMF